MLRIVQLLRIITKNRRAVEQSSKYILWHLVVFASFIMSASRREKTHQNEYCDQARSGDDGHANSAVSLSFCMSVSLYLSISVCTRHHALFRFWTCGCVFKCVRQQSCNTHTHTRQTTHPITCPPLANVTAQSDCWTVLLHCCLTRGWHVTREPLLYPGGLGWDRFG